jgi:hypothetical protein
LILKHFKINATSSAFEYQSIFYKNPTPGRCDWIFKVNPEELIFKVRPIIAVFRPFWWLSIGVLTFFDGEILGIEHRRAWKLTASMLISMFG